MTSLNRITIHWTAGVYRPNAIDKSHYHFLVDGNGKIINGTHKPEDNIDCKDGNYAAHCGGGNTGNIGISICGMYDKYKYPITRKQVEACCYKVAELSIKYGIPVTTNNIFTHAEFGISHPSTTSNGKVDIINLPCLNLYGAKMVGDELRNKIHYYRVKIKSQNDSH